LTLKSVSTRLASDGVSTGTCTDGCALEGGAPRFARIGQALRLEYLTVGWNIVEGVIAVTAGVLASSVALLGFGIDSFVESVSGAVMIWRLLVERASRLSDEKLEAIEHRARRLVAVSLFSLAGWISFDAAQTLWQREHPDFSLVGVALTSISLVVMVWLARAKRRVAREIGSRAMEADAFQTTACWWLSLAALAGIGLNGAVGWWWADPVAGFVIAALVVKEGREAWKGEQECC
jgi:divalent metal cation (Fe/Co/Zn/Cd) transporter